MTVPTAIFCLYRYTSSGCAHDLLVRARRPGCSNADQSAQDAADAFARSASDHLRSWWERWRLPLDCEQRHTAELIGAMEEAPARDELHDAGQRRHTVWVAASGYGRPWVVLDVAATEADFWSQVRDDPDLLALRPEPPAVAHDVYFVTDEDGGAFL